MTALMNHLEANLKLFEVIIQRTEYSMAKVVVDAPNEEEAEQLAIEITTEFVVQNAEEEIIEIERVYP